MSLKSFHLIFLLVSSLFSIFFSYWCYDKWSLHEDGQYLIYLAIGIMLCISILFYGKWFLKKITQLNAN